jgi:hypothetical protein
MLDFSSKIKNSLYSTKLITIIIWQASLPVQWRTVIGWEALSAGHYGGPLRKNKRTHFKTKQQN